MAEDLELKKPEVTHYNNSEHMEYHKEICPLCEKYADIINSPELLINYRNRLIQEEYVRQWVRKSEYTEKKHETDRERDTAYRGIEDIIEVNLTNFNSALRDYAKHLNNLLAGFGDVPNKSYNAESADIDTLVAKLKSPEYLPAVESLGLVAWVTELETKNTLFKSYIDDSTQEQTLKPKITLRSARREGDKALQHITGRVSALIDLNGPDTFVDFVTEFNVITNRYNTVVNEHYGRLHAKTDISEAQIAPIGVQKYTSKPVYVIPTVSIVKKENNGEETVIELVFSRDYTLAYKNNVDPGTATLIINGIGKYSGEIVTRFNIEHEI